MRKLVYYIATTFDGFIAGPDGADPTGPDGFWPLPADYIQHIATHYPETLPAPARTALSVTAKGTHFGTVLEGRRSHEIGLKAGVTNAFPHLRHLVFSRPSPRAPTPPSNWSPPTRPRRYVTSNARTARTSGYSAAPNWPARSTTRSTN